MLQHGGALKTFHHMKSDSHKKANTVWFHLYDIPRVDGFIKTEGDVLMTTAVGRRVEGCCPVVQDEESSENDSRVVAQQYKCA